MKLIYLVLIYLLIPIPQLKSQADTIEENVFAYVNDPFGKTATYLLKKSPFGYKYETTLKVMEGLMEAKGVRSMARPTLIMNNAEKRVAWAKPAAAVIGLEEKAYDICTTFGKDSLNAIAALIAHELTHYYEKHDWKNQFARNFGSDVSSNHSSEEKMDVEIQADYLGGFLAYTAGYNISGIMPKLLDSIYQNYAFPDEIKGYPSLSTRKKLATKSQNKLADLIPVFEMANYLIALGDYESAKAYYDYILKKEKYQSREIYNNLGITAILAAMNFFSQEKLKFVYPVELDIYSRLNRTSRGQSDSDEQKEIRNVLLKHALENFQTALSLDKNYAPALLNLGCAYALTGNYFEAQYHAQKALLLSNTQNDTLAISNAQILLGIIAAQSGHGEKSETYFKQAQQQNNTLAALNLKLLYQDSIPVIQPPEPTNTPQESIKNINLDEVVNRFYSGGLDTQKELEINNKLLFALVEYKNSNLFLHFSPFEEVYLFIHFTDAKYSGKTLKGITLGDDRKKIVAPENYGRPERIITLTEGQFLIYFSKNTLFQLDEHHQVKRWGVFRRGGG